MFIVIRLGKISGRQNSTGRIFATIVILSLNLSLSHVMISLSSLDLLFMVYIFLLNSLLLLGNLSRREERPRLCNHVTS